MDAYIFFKILLFLRQRESLHNNSFLSLLLKEIENDRSANNIVLNKQVLMIATIETVIFSSMLNFEIKFIDESR